MFPFDSLLMLVLNLARVTAGRSDGQQPW